MREFWQRVWDVVVPTDPEEFWSLVAALVSGMVLWVAVRGLRSLKLTREGMLNQAHREARAAAIARCEEFAADIIPANAAIVNAFAAYRTPVFVEDAADVRFDPDSRDDLPRAEAWFQELPSEVRSDCIALMNRMEAWAMYFTHQLADPAVAFGPCAPYFCSRVVQLYPYLLIARNRDPSSGNYPNVVALFKVWITELEEQKRGLIRGRLLEQLAELQATGSPRSTLKPPLGTQLEL
jgi:hypothetical protein